jgi:ATP-dependent DNA helicase RecQ
VPLLSAIQRVNVVFDKNRQMEGYIMMKEAKSSVGKHACINKNDDSDSIDDFERQVALKILGCVKLVAGKCGRTKVASILIGSPTHFALEHGYNESEYFGALDMFSKSEVLHIIDGLIEDGYLNQHFANDKPYPLLTLTERGDQALVESEKIKVRLPWDLAPKPIAKPENKDAYEALREMRRIQAAIERVEPYKIMTNRAILDLAQKLPRSYDELNSICGLGHAKISKYGALILQTLACWSGKDFVEFIDPSSANNNSSSGLPPNLTSQGFP